MKLLLPLVVFVPSAAFSQIDLYEDFESGAPKSWPATTVSLAYEVPEPIGPVKLNFQLEIEPLTVNPYNGTDFMRLVGGSISYRDMGTIDLPARVLACLPEPRPHEASLVTLYIEPPDSETHWFDEFTSYVTIPFGRPTWVTVEGVEFRATGSVEFALTGGTLRRAKFETAEGDTRVLDEVTNACPREVVDWVSPPREATRRASSFSLGPP